MFKIIIFYVFCYRLVWCVHIKIIFKENTLKYYQTGQYYSLFPFCLLNKISMFNLLGWKFWEKKAKYPFQIGIKGRRRLIDKPEELSTFISLNKAVISTSFQNTKHQVHPDYIAITLLGYVHILLFEFLAFRFYLLITLLSYFFLV